MKLNRLSFANSVILVAVSVLTATGAYGLYWSMPGWFWVKWLGRMEAIGLENID